MGHKAQYWFRRITGKRAKEELPTEKKQIRARRREIACDVAIKDLRAAQRELWRIEKAFSESFWDNLVDIGEDFDGTYTAATNIGLNVSDHISIIAYQLSIASDLMFQYRMSLEGK